MAQPTPESATRRRIVDSAGKLYYRDGINRVSVDAIAAHAGVTKRTLYYHFRSKDDLVACVLTERDQPNIAQLRSWFEDGGPGTIQRIGNLFANLERVAGHPKWRGCAFLRTVSELASLPGHPARKAGAQHKRNLEDWLAAELDKAGLRDAGRLAMQIAILIDGAFSAALVHRDPSYFRIAGDAAASLVHQASARKPGGATRKRRLLKMTG